MQPLARKLMVAMGKIPAEPEKMNRKQRRQIRAIERAERLRREQLELERVFDLERQRRL